ncbi:hypothetical protein Tco_0542787 [Tanacetum coccineum]
MAPSSFPLSLGFAEGVFSPNPCMGCRNGDISNELKCVPFIDFEDYDVMLTQHSRSIGVHGLHRKGEENVVNILKSIDEGPFQMGTFQETLAEGTEGALHLEGSELTKEDQESQLYDDFEHFRQNKGETIHDYYVRFAKLINDMRNIKMTMSRMQLNSKFVNNMLPEWGRFVTVVKLNRG